jgi:hypothetical protein
MAWNALEIVKIDIASYHETIQVYKLPKRLQFELDTSRKTSFCNLYKATIMSFTIILVYDSFSRFQQVVKFGFSTSVECLKCLLEIDN